MSSSHAFLLALATVAALAATAASRESSVLYSVTNVANNTVGGSRFQNLIGFKDARATMYAATRSTWSVFNQTDESSDRKKISSISLFIEDMVMNETASRQNLTTDVGIVGYAKGTSIHLNAHFIGNYTGNLRRQFNGIIYEKVASIWQWDARGQAPPGLITGIAHYVRLQARYGTPEKVKPGEGDRWDQGNGVTARFLTYCNQLRRGFVADMNRKLKHGYTDGYFLDLLKMPVDQVWSNYKAKYHN